MDERRDPGEFYPGGRVIAREGVAPGQTIVNWSDIQGKPDFSDVAALGEEATRGEMKQTMNTVINKLKTSVLIGTLFAIGAALADVEPRFAKADDIPGNMQIMTNTQEYVDAKVDSIPAPDFTVSNDTLVATIKTTAPAPGDYANVSNAAMNAVQPSVATNIAEAVAASATNGLASASSLTNYATRAELDAGWWSEWTFSKTPQTGHYRVASSTPLWILYYVNSEGEEDAIEEIDKTSDDESEIYFPLIELTATRHRVAAPVPTMADLGGKASTNDVVLTPLLSEWTYSASPSAAGYYYVLSFYGTTWKLYETNGSTENLVDSVYDSSQNATSLNFPTAGVIATRTVVGYQLGSQTNKVLASTNGLARASDVADARAVADAAASTNATQGAALSQLSQRTNDWDAAAQNASDALAYSRAIYDFQQGNTNAWFSGTNFVFGADATNKTAFAFEPGMDLMTMPCSLALMEIRDGLTQKVWDQRDWTVWYWNFKNAQYEATVAERLSAAAAFNATNYAPIAWGRRTSSGRANPDSKTLWVDAEKTVLAPGMAWESTVEVSGCAYWTIVGNATLSGNTNGVISIRDFEGNPVFRIRKTSSYLVYLETGSEIYTSGWDAQGRITYTMRASVHPVGVFSTVLDDSLFVEETNAGCPVDYEWETLEQPSANSPGVYRIHFLLKPGISSDGCFAKFKVEVQGETAVEFIAVQKITGGQVYDDGTHGDVKIRPVITSTAVGSVVTWEVAP